MSNMFNAFPMFPMPGTSVPLEVRSERAFNLFNIRAIIDERPTTIPAKSGARKTMLERISETTSANISFRRAFIFLIFFT